MEGTSEKQMPLSPNEKVELQEQLTQFRRWNAHLLQKLQEFQQDITINDNLPPPPPPLQSSGNIDQQINDSFRSFSDQDTNRAISIKPQPFNKADPTLWFMQLEMLFALNHLTTDEAKFQYAAVNLDNTISDLASDIIKSPPPSGKYQALKQCIINAVAESEETQLRRLISGVPYDMSIKPSIFLQRLRNMAHGKCTAVVLRTLFLEKLPHNIQSLLAISRAQSLNDLAADADKIFETMNMNSMNISSINSVRATSLSESSNNSGISEMTSALKTMTLGLSEMQKSIDLLTTSMKTLIKNSERGGSRNRSSSRSQNKDKFELCYYHAKYGAKATKCRPPCLLGEKQEN